MTPHFTDAELACKCGCGMLPQRDFMERVEGVRLVFGRPMKVTSAARCAKYNATVSSTGTTGPHTTGRAIDFALAGEDAFDVMKLAMKRGFTGIGVSQKGEWGKRFLHLDDLLDDVGQPRPRVWSY